MQRQWQGTDLEAAIQFWKFENDDMLGDDFRRYPVEHERDENGVQLRTGRTDMGDDCYVAVWRDKDGQVWAEEY